MEDLVSTVSLHADYILYQDRYYPAALIIVSDRSVRIEGLVANRDAEPFVCEWVIDDVKSIESQWCDRVKVVKGRLCLLAKGSDQNKILQNAADLEEIRFAVFDPDWVYRQEKIKSLNIGYRAIWKDLPPIDDFDGEDTLPINKIKFFSRPYFPNFEEHFEDVVYPEGDVDAVSICKRDVDLLRPETFVNDTIIDFYIKFLKNKIQPEGKNRFHFFNSFFFRKLADLDKNPESAFDGKAAFQRVRKWTRKLNLFEKDYIFIPVNYSLHWSLIVICHPGEVAGSIDCELNESSKVPCILHMDSIRGSHSGLKNLIQSYLCEEWKERHKDMPEDISLKFLNLRFLSLELPQQENCYDCGLFLLHYVELFVEDAPLNFDPFKITKLSNFLTSDWFMPAEVSLKRAYIQRLISKILRDHFQRGGPSCASEELYPSKRQKHGSTDEVAIGLSSEISDAENSKYPNTCYLGSAQDIGISFLETSSYKTSQRTSQPVQGLYDPGSSSGSFFGLYQLSERGNISPVQEEDQINEQIEYSGRRTSNLTQLNSTSEGCNNIELFGHPFPWVEEDVDGDEVEDSDDSEEEGVSNHEEQHHEGENSSGESGLNSDEGDDDVKFIEESSLRREAHNHGQIKNQDHHDLPQPRCPLIDNLNTLDDSFASALGGMMGSPVEDSEEEVDFDGSDDDNSESEDLVCPTSEHEKNSDSMEPKQDQEQVTGKVFPPELDIPRENGKLDGDASGTEVNGNTEHVESGDFDKMSSCEDQRLIVFNSSSDLDDELLSPPELDVPHNNGKLEGDASLAEVNGNTEGVESAGDFDKMGPCEDKPLIVFNSSSDSDVSPMYAKRLRLSSPPNNRWGMKLTSSLFKDEL